LVGEFFSISTSSGHAACHYIWKQPSQNDNKEEFALFLQDQFKEQAESLKHHTTYGRTNAALNTRNY
jgi:hypothetical protein